MSISELKTGQGKIDLTIEIVSIEPAKSYNKFGKEFRVANAMVKDHSGEIKMSFWNDDIEKLIAGKKVKILNGYVSEFKGEKQLSAGKFGKTEFLD